MFARLCLILHFVECTNHGIRPNRIPVSAATAKQAHDLLMNVFLPEASRVFRELVDVSEDMANARWIAGHILAHKADMITVHKLTRAHGPFKNKVAIQKAVEILELASWVKPKPLKDKQ